MDTHKRSALKKTATRVAALSTTVVWSKPIVQSVVLPAHATTSQAEVTPLQSLSGSWRGRYIVGNDLSSSTTGFLGAGPFSLVINSEGSGIISAIPGGPQFTVMYNVSPPGGRIIYISGGIQGMGGFNDSFDQIIGILFPATGSTTGENFVANKL